MTRPRVSVYTFAHMLDSKWSAQAIRELRAQLGLTQQQFAVHLGVTVGAVSRWETGDQAPSNLACAALERLAGGREAGRC